LSKERSLKSSFGIASFPIWRAPTAAPQKYKVRGKSATSYEYNTAQALTNEGLDFLFQVSYFGGHALPGGIVLDFLVFTKPLYTPLMVNGDYWHSGQRRAIDEFQIIQINYMLAGQAREVVEFWGIDCATYPAALASVRREIL
jgi:hypothetical protein